MAKETIVDAETIPILSMRIGTYLICSDRLENGELIHHVFKFLDILKILKQKNVNNGTVEVSQTTKMTSVERCTPRSAKVLSLSAR